MEYGAPARVLGRLKELREILIAGKNNPCIWGNVPVISQIAATKANKEIEGAVGSWSQPS